MKKISKKIATSAILIIMALSIMTNTPLYADYPNKVQDTSPLDYLDPRRPVEN